ncbi:MAG: preprotein translocase subunit SecG [marine bacterium B5-7]|nr:MAG: preprotein translocase subunit SecG [marine bacterium B5-7]
MLTSILTAIHLLAAISIVVLVLLQQGKGADMGAAFGGGGSSQSLFGSRGSANFLSRATSILATVFFITGLSLAYIYARQSGFESVTQSVESVPVERAGDLPAVPSDSASESSGVPSTDETSQAGDVPAIPDVPEGGGQPSQ